MIKPFRREPAHRPGEHRLLARQIDRPEPPPSQEFQKAMEMFGKLGGRFEQGIDVAHVAEVTEKNIGQVTEGLNKMQEYADVPGERSWLQMLFAAFNSIFGTRITLEGGRRERGRKGVRSMIARSPDQGQPTVSQQIGQASVASQQKRKKRGAAPAPAAPAQPRAKGQAPDAAPPQKRETDNQGTVKLDQASRQGSTDAPKAEIDTSKIEANKAKIEQQHAPKPDAEMRRKTLDLIFRRIPHETRVEHGETIYIYQPGDVTHEFKLGSPPDRKVLTRKKVSEEPFTEWAEPTSRTPLVYRMNLNAKNAFEWEKGIQADFKTCVERFNASKKQEKLWQADKSHWRNRTDLGYALHAEWRFLFHCTQHQPFSRETPIPVSSGEPITMGQRLDQINALNKELGQMIEENARVVPAAAATLADVIRDFGSVAGTEVRYVGNAVSCERTPSGQLAFRLYERNAKRWLPPEAYKVLSEHFPNRVVPKKRDLYGAYRASREMTAPDLQAFVKQCRESLLNISGERGDSMMGASRDILRDVLSDVSVCPEGERDLVRRAVTFRKNEATGEFQWIFNMNELRGRLHERTIKILQSVTNGEDGSEYWSTGPISMGDMERLNASLREQLRKTQPRMDSKLLYENGQRECTERNIQNVDQAVERFNALARIARIERRGNGFVVTADARCPGYTPSLQKFLGKFIYRCLWVGSMNATLPEHRGRGFTMELRSVSKESLMGALRALQTERVTVTREAANDTLVESFYNILHIDCSVGSMDMSENFSNDAMRRQIVINALERGGRQAGTGRNLSGSRIPLGVYLSPSGDLMEDRRGPSAGDPVLVPGWKDMFLHNPAEGVRRLRQTRGNPNNAALQHLKLRLGGAQDMLQSTTRLHEDVRESTEQGMQRRIGLVCQDILARSMLAARRRIEWGLRRNRRAAEASEKHHKSAHVLERIGSGSAAHAKRERAAEASYARALKELNGVYGIWGNAEEMPTQLTQRLETIARILASTHDPNYAALSRDLLSTRAILGRTVGEVRAAVDETIVGDVVSCVPIVGQVYHVVMGLAEATIEGKPVADILAQRGFNFIPLPGAGTAVRVGRRTILTATRGMSRRARRILARSPQLLADRAEDIAQDTASDLTQKAIEYARKRDRGTSPG